MSLSPSSHFTFPSFLPFLLSTAHPPLPSLYISIFAPASALTDLSVRAHGTSLLIVEAAVVPTRHVGATRWVTVAALCWHLFVLREHVLLHACKCCLEVVVVCGNGRPCAADALPFLIFV